MAASGALGFDGRGWPWERWLKWFGLFDPALFTVVIKTLTRRPEKGNLSLIAPWRCIRLLDGGVLNAVELTNPGIDWWCRKIGPKINRAEISLVGSLFSEDADELKDMVEMLNDFDLVALEVNASCPNIESDCLSNAAKIIAHCRVAEKFSRFPVILKLSVVHDIEKIVPGIEGSAEAISLNSVPWSVIFPDRPSPLKHLGGGGVSGKPARDATWNTAKKLARLTSIPVIVPGVSTYSDMKAMDEFGAPAYSFGSLFLRRPWEPTRIVKKDKRRKNTCMKHCRKKN